VLLPLVLLGYILAHVDEGAQQEAAEDEQEDAEGGEGQDRVAGGLVGPVGVLDPVVIVCGETAARAYVFRGIHDFCFPFSLQYFLILFSLGWVRSTTVNHLVLLFKGFYI